MTMTHAQVHAQMEHYREAERLLKEVGDPVKFVLDGGNPDVSVRDAQLILAAAQVHATLSGPA